MKIILTCLALLMATPAVADDLADFYRQQREKKVARIAAHNAALRKQDSEFKAKCDKVGVPAIGLTAEGVAKTCWGKPHRINTTATAAHISEQWVYGGGYVNLTDGIVTSIQISR